MQTSLYDIGTAAETKVLTVLTDTWSTRTAGMIVRQWPDRDVKVRYLRGEGGESPADGRQPSVEAEVLDPDISTIRTPDGTKFKYALFLHLWELTSRFHATVLKDSFAPRLIGRAYSSRCAEVLYLRRFYHTVEPWVFLCLFARHLAVEEPDTEESTVVFLPANPFGQWAIDYLRTIYPHVMSSELSYLQMLRTQGGPVLRLLLGWLARKPFGTLRRSSNEDRPTPDRRGALSSMIDKGHHDSRPSIAVEACWGLEPEKGRSDIFWLPQTDLDGSSRVMAYFDRADTPASDELLVAMQRQGLDAVVLRRDGGTAKTAEVSSYESSLGWRQRLLMLVVAPLWLVERLGRRRTAHWCWVNVYQSLGGVATWQALFKAQNVRLHSNHSDVQSGPHMNQSAALERAGGLNMRTDTTSTYNPAMRLASRITPFDVFWAWGPYMAGVFRGLDVAEITTLVTCGYPFDYLFEGARREAAGIRGRLQAAGASRIISFFDSAFNKTTHTSREDLELIYRALLNEVIENPGLGLVLKPKKRWDETVLVSAELRALLDEAVATGRCISLVRKSESDRIIYPYEAALAADLAVGYPINTAVIEAVIAGVPGVHIDLTREPGHPFYEVGYEQFVFDDLDRAMDPIRRWVCDAADAPGLGDHSKVIDSLDPFRDGKAADRAGQYVAWSMEGFTQGLCRDDVVRRASRLYGEKYGAEHVRLAPRLGSS